MNKYSAIVLFSLLFLLSSCFYGPKYYEKDGQMYVKGNDFKWGKYDLLIDGADPATFRKLEYAFSLDANHVYYLTIVHGKKVDILEGANPATFELLDSYYCRDSLHVWFRRQRPIILIPEADSKSFHILGYGYARTDSLVFYTGRPKYGIDPNTIVVHTRKYVEDKNDVYWEQKPLHVTDRETFTPVYKEGVLDYWAKDKNYVYYLGYHENDSNIVRSAIADYESFEVIDEDYARDKVQVYFCDSILYEADPASLVKLNYWYVRDNRAVFCDGRKICDYNSSFKLLDDRYIADGKYVYYKGEVLKNADIASFTIILSGGVAKDKNQVYYDNTIIEGADPKTYQWLEQMFFKDATQVFYTHKKVEGADPSSFKPLYNDYAYDKNHYFYHGVLIPESDVSTFELQHNGYAMDKNHYYHDGRIIAEADYITFENLFNYYAKDKNHYYYKGIVMQDIDYPSFQLLEMYFAKDKDHVFYRGKIVEGADPETFEVKRDGIGKDKYREYNLR